MQFKIGDKVRFKGQDEWKKIEEVQSLCNGELNILTEGCRVWYPSSCFTKQQFKSIHRVPFSCVILPLTMERIKKSAQSTKISEGKLIDQWAEGATK